MVTSLKITIVKMLSLRQAQSWDHHQRTNKELGIRLEPNLLLLPILLFGNAQKFYLFCPELCQHLPTVFCPKLCQHLPICPHAIMPVLNFTSEDFARKR